MKDIITYFTKHVVVRYIIAGGTGASTDLVILYVLNGILKIQYLVAAILAFLLAFCVSFVLHKYWTFKSHGQETHKQAMLYMLTSLFALSLNTLFMYIFVGHFHFAVILSQIFAGALVAFSSFFISRTVVFKYKKEHNTL
jgi:putative flippase GtrA